MGKMKDEKDLELISIADPAPEPESINSSTEEIDFRRAYPSGRPPPRSGKIQRLIDRPLLISELKREIAYLPPGELGIVVVVEIFAVPKGHRAAPNGGWLVRQVTALDSETREELMVAFPRKGVLGVLETQRGGPKIYRTLDTLVAQLRDTIGAKGLLQFNVMTGGNKA